MAKKDYYKILGIDRQASPEEIKKAFYRLAHEYHPHKAGKDEKKFKELNEKFKEINEAYQVLSNKEKNNNTTVSVRFLKEYRLAAAGNGLSVLDRISVRQLTDLVFILKDSAILEKFWIVFLKGWEVTSAAAPIGGVRMWN